MRKLLSTWLVIFALFNGAFAHAADIPEVDSITVLSDRALAVPLAQAATRFAHTSMVSVANVFGNPVEQQKKIEEGEPADLFITDTPDLIQQLKIKGLIDVYSINEIASKDDKHYTAVVVASENMTPARTFLDFLRSEEGKAIFTRNHWLVPTPLQR